MTKFVSTRIAGLQPNRLIGKWFRVKEWSRPVATERPVRTTPCPKDKDLLQRLREAGL